MSLDRLERAAEEVRLIGSDVGDVGTRSDGEAGARVDRVLRADIAGELGRERRFRPGQGYDRISRIAIVTKRGCLGCSDVVADEGWRKAEHVDDIAEATDRAVQIGRAEVEREIPPASLASGFDAPDPASGFGIARLATVDDTDAACARREAEHRLIVANIFVVGVELRAHMSVEKGAFPADFVFPDLDRLIRIMRRENVDALDRVAARRRDISKIVVRRLPLQRNLAVDIVAGFMLRAAARWIEERNERRGEAKSE